MNVGHLDQNDDIGAANAAKEQYDSKIDDDEITAATNVEQHHKNVLPPDEKLRVLVTQGCSGSSFIVTAIRGFLQTRGMMSTKEIPRFTNPIKTLCLNW